MNSCGENNFMNLDRVILSTFTLQWGIAVLPPPHWSVKSKCSCQVCLQVKNKGDYHALLYDSISTVM